MSWETFERYRQRGLDARRAGQWDAARVYLLEAAREMVTLSMEAQRAELKAARQEAAQKLLDLARDCGAAKSSNRRSPALRAHGAKESNASADNSDDGKDASQWLVLEKPSISFDDIAGLDDVKEDVRLKMLYPFRHPELAEKFDVRPGGGILLYGPPGTGKTMLARAVAGELDAAFYRVSAAELLSKWVGEAEQNIKKLFDTAAADERSVIFIDEIESLIPARRDEGSSVMQRVVPQILQGMEGFDRRKGRTVLFLGATNVPWQLDPAVLRPGRFDEKIYVPLPDLAARRKMLDLYLANRPLAQDVGLDALAEQVDGYSGADIKYLCDRAAIVPFMRGVAGDADPRIDAACLDDALADTPRSVTPAQVRRFEDWTRASR